jgi:cold shock CspA family protein
MAIGEATRFQPAKVLFFNVRAGYGKAITRTGRKVRVPLGALHEARLLTLDPGQEVYVSLDEHDHTRVEALRLPEPPVEQKPPAKKQK